MTPEILTRLQNLEIEEGVKILYACESGSRAWGFPSADSDYGASSGYQRFYRREIARLETAAFHTDLASPPVEPLNRLFRDALAEVWP